MSNIFVKIVHGLEWFGKEIGKGFAQLPKIIRLTKDAEAVAQQAIPQVTAVIVDAGELVTASAKDSGVFIKSLSWLATAVSEAVAAKALDITKDKAVIAAFEAFISDFKAENVADVLSALDKLANDTKLLDATVLAGLKKLEQDAV